jgi:hypothetical protein
MARPKDEFPPIEQHFRYDWETMQQPDADYIIRNKAGDNLALRALAIDALTHKAARLANNLYSSCSTHHRQIQRAQRPNSPAPFQTWEGFVARYPNPLFVDTVRLWVMVDNPISTARGTVIPPQARKEIQALFKGPSGDGPTVSVLTQNRSNLGFEKKKVRIEVEAKTHNVPFQIVWDVLCRINKANPYELPCGALLRIKDFDTTVNFPGAIRPTTMDVRKKMGRPYLGLKWGRYEVKDNAHFVGLQCVTYARSEGKSGFGPGRYTVTDLDGNEIPVAKELKGPEIKFYCKFFFHLETTSVQNPSGNNWQALAHSPHENILRSTHDPLFQKHGHGRQEIRWPGDEFPTLEEILELHELSYNEFVRRYAHSESFVETLDWFFSPVSSVQVAVVERIVNKPGYWNVCLITNFNSLTNKSRCEVQMGVSTQIAKHFLTNAKIGPIDLEIYWEGQPGFNWYKHIHIGPTSSVPNLGYLNPEKYGKDRCHAKWAKETLEAVGLVGAPFCITQHPFPNSANEVPMEIWDGQQPDFTAQAKREQARKNWVEKVLRPKQRELGARLDMRPNFDASCQKISDIPAMARVVGVWRNRNRNFVIALENQKGGTTNYVIPNTHSFAPELHAEMEYGICNEMPVVLIRDIEAEKEWWAKNIRKRNAKPPEIKLQYYCADTVEECANNEYLREGQWEILYWSEHDFCTYGDIQVRGKA